MQLSERTFSILKNFSTINQSILIRPGSKIRTMHPDGMILAEAEVPETFESEVVIDKVKQFLDMVTQFGLDSDIDFQEKCLVISKGEHSARLLYTKPDLVSHTDKNVPMPDEPPISFDISADELTRTLQFAKILQVPNIGFVGKADDPDHIQMIAYDEENHENNHVINLERENDYGDFEVIFKVEKMKMIPQDYTVSLTEKYFAEFKAKGDDIYYWFTANKSSQFGGNDESDE